ncbi:hypothetical protein [Streptomyces sp. NPDC002588]|uniref:hypothetical protein n=1 Tax=Streptomyces sp. NPDC002588 TaxID=3154419 RepID=UPI003317574F
MREQLLTAVSGQQGQAMTFSDLAEATSVPSVGRANIVRLRLTTSTANSAGSSSWMTTAARRPARSVGSSTMQTCGFFRQSSQGAHRRSPGSRGRWPT